MAKKKPTATKKKPESSQGVSKPLVYGPRVNSGTPAKKSEPKKP